MNQFIIHRPDLQTPRRRFSYGFLTFIFWIIWFYLWLPLISFGGWLFGVDLFYDQMVVQEGLQSLLGLLSWYLLVIFLISLTLGVWALVNLMRFRGKDRRGERKVVANVSLANDFCVTTQQLEKWSDSKRLIISHDVNGKIDEVEVLFEKGFHGNQKKDSSR